MRFLQDALMVGLFVLLLVFLAGYLVTVAAIPVVLVVWVVKLMLRMIP